MSSRSRKRSLSRYYNASQLRFDTWHHLKEAARHLDRYHHEPDADPKQIARQRELIELCFETLGPIEGYWAFPGKDLLATLQSQFAREEYQVLAANATYVVRMLASDLYRSVAAAGQLANLEKLGSEAYFSRFERNRNGGAEKHYFEVLFVDDLAPAEERGLRRRMLELVGPEDQFVYDLVVAPSFEDALIAVLLNPNIQSCVLRSSFSFRSANDLEVLQPYLENLADFTLEPDKDADLSITLGRMIKQLRPELDLYLVLDSAAEDVAGRVYDDFRRVFFRQDDYMELYLSIRRGILERYDTPFFFALKEYSQRPTGVFHAMPISRGNSVFKSHWIQDMGRFYGRSIFLAETSATSGGLDSLLQPTGPLKKAQQLAARAFGAQHTFFVTNGTSTANKIVVQALVKPGELVLVDRDCHKSHHYGLVLAGAYPIYLDSYSLQSYSIYGAVPLREIKRRLLELRRAGKLEQVKMLLLTNCTFDGLVYNVERVMEEVLAIKPDMVFLWDEAWFGFAGFAPEYRQRTAMHAARRLHERYQSDSYRERYRAFATELAEHRDDDAWLLEHHLLPDPEQVRLRAYSTHSTHKKLSSFRQGSMIHIWDEEFKRQVEDTFLEAYMTHTSTSPNYQILASLDLARRQAELEGFELVQKSVELAMALRARITDNPLLRRYFRVLMIQDLIPDEYRPSGIRTYYDPESGWRRLEDAWRADEFVLDPTHITLFIGNTGVDGDTFKNRYLMDQYGIQVNKTSRNTVLFMTNIGTTRSAVAYLIGVLLKIARQLEQQERAFGPAELALHRRKVAALTEKAPPLPHFSAFHRAFRPDDETPGGDLRKAYFLAYDDANCEHLPLDEQLDAALAAGREIVAATFVIPYPPGFPILVPGQLLSAEILAFMRALDVKEIHGFRPELGLRVFTEAALASLGADDAQRESPASKPRADKRSRSSKGRKRDHATPDPQTP